MANPFGRLMGLARRVAAGRAKPHFVVMDVKRQSLDDLRGQTLHEQRKAGDLSHVDPERTKLNRRGGHNGNHDDPRAAVEAFLKDNQVKVDKRNTKPVTSFVLSASHEYFDSPEKQEVWVSETMKWARDEFGDDIAHTSLHLDERTPHIHLKVVPTYEKKTKRRTVRQASHHKHKAFEGFRSYDGLLDRYAARMEPLGLHRGEKVPEEAGRTYRTARQFVNEMARRWNGRSQEMALLDEREAKVSQREAKALEREDSLNREAGELVAYRKTLDECAEELVEKAESIDELWLKSKALADVRPIKAKMASAAVEEPVKRIEKRARRSTTRKGKAPAER